MTVSAARHNDTEHPDMARCDGSPPVGRSTLKWIWI
jgi:hypothetical protein